MGTWHYNAKQYPWMRVSFLCGGWFGLSLVVALFSRAPAQSRDESSAKAAAVVVLSQLREPEGVQRCEFCHAAEVEGYARSAMAHSLARAGQEPDGILTAGNSRITIHSSSTG